MIITDIRDSVIITDNSKEGNLIYFRLKCYSAESIYAAEDFFITK